jgi:RNA polymerase sigma factor for flagellar operon FliA
MSMIAQLIESGASQDRSSGMSPTAEPDDESFQHLVEQYLPLVRSIADRMKPKLPSNIETEELYSIGMTGLVAAARNCRPSQRSSFISYASTRIRGAILDELRRMDWMTRGTRSKAKKLDSVISRLEQEQGGTVGQESLCAEMHMSEDELSELMDEVKPVRLISFDSPDDNELEELSLHEIIPDDSSIPALDALERKELVTLLAARIAQLPEVPKKVLAMYYYEGLRLADIAACFNLTESRICQIHTQAVSQLRTYLFSVLA